MEVAKGKSYSALRKIWMMMRFEFPAGKFKKEKVTSKLHFVICKLNHLNSAPYSSVPLGEQTEYENFFSNLYTGMCVCVARFTGGGDNCGFGGESLRHSPRLRCAAPWAHGRLVPVVVEKRFLARAFNMRQHSSVGPEPLNRPHCLLLSHFHLRRTANFRTT